MPIIAARRLRLCILGHRVIEVLSVQRTIFGNRPAEYRVVLGGFMRRSIAVIAGATAAVGIMFIPAAALAGTHGQAPGKKAPAGNDPPTTVTFAVTSGELTIAVPPTADLGSGAPGSTISSALGTVTVTDNRALLHASWTAEASSTSYTTGTGTTAETIPANDVTYAPGTVTTSGTITASASDITLSGSPQTVVSGSAGVGDNTASWDPTIAVHVPVAAVVGPYHGTIDHSVL